MKKQLIIGALSFCAVGCASMDDSTVVVDDAGYTHHTMSYLSDTRGQSSFPLHRPATGKKVFVFDPQVPAWAAYDAEGNLVKTGSASGGKDYCEDVGRKCRTVTGVYRVYSKKGPECTSSIYPIETNGGAKMPYCMHFSGGYSIHAAYEVPGYNASHGCIRVLPSAARWLNEDFINVGTTVIVKPY
ncbi:MAG: L,D-transpeptidase [Gammaproteobacteria bacterium]|nr:L,D-transpeptidase [Gammaproteobacteria bacterium]